MSYCIVIPNYNHTIVIDKLLGDLAEYKLPVIMINDGSDADSSAFMLGLAEKYSYVTLISHVQNQGKGAAIQTGLKYADSMGFTHAVQVDADGQHNITDINKLVELSQAQPSQLISGQPIYNESVPKHRYYARYLTHVWVWIETLSFDIKDTMCGFRVYPLAETLGLLAKNNNIGEYMAFDTEIMVRLYWDGVNTIFLPTKVNYPENGVSHFRLWEDNVAISWMHTRLFFGMLKRLPQLLLRKFRT
ncbi:Glycosyl transferase, group 2 family protein [Moritella viscosa]|uniref:Glycosyl transferase, group 2 family protein n=1 Tax=Moritella viscosa TaxID=80854 RepID=A0A090K6U8_9GAMM|nr:glycosyltransferase family 2 protein [Moritella viscosa]CED59478.1 putative glucosyl transferase [Moritella viscosa]SGY87936.1 Glycosyl transferase, group 2 family protein [Moritella viscosa]SGY89841.1 Glycosyl transferase, group 2 family protein [Moritella viscosa]SHO00870.1 Glycosyl transferase, group 2 family protein [Moritella viscosa]SHO01811.1 Glycosyl transferase, group 2 family protein [Moritella viscosa]